MKYNLDDVVYDLRGDFEEAKIISIDNSGEELQYIIGEWDDGFTMEYVRTEEEISYEPRPRFARR